MPSGFSVQAYVDPSGGRSTLGSRTLTGPGSSERSRSTQARTSASETVACSCSTANLDQASPSARVGTRMTPSATSSP